MRTGDDGRGSVLVVSGRAHSNAAPPSPWFPAFAGTTVEGGGRSRGWRRAFAAISGQVRVKRVGVLFVRWRARSYYSGLLGRGVTGVYRAGTAERIEI